MKTVNVLSLIIVLLVGVVACNNLKKSLTTKSNEQTEEVKAENKANYLIVKLSSDVEIETLEEEFSTIDLKFQNVVSEVLRIYLFSYDTLEISSEEVLDIIKTSDNIIEAEFDKKVELRGN